jgi:8-oxo-dGTP pyrophosphatase MutT (NUDIX family)
MQSIVEQDICNSILTAADIVAKHRRYTFRAGILAVNARDDSVLLVRERKRDQFPGNIISIPKGVYNEMRDITFWDTASRELYEETGIEIDLKNDRVMETVQIFHNKYLREITIVFIVILRDAPLADTHDTREVEECIWVRNITELMRDSNIMPRYMRALLRVICGAEGLHHSTTMCTSSDSAS